MREQVSKARTRKRPNGSQMRDSTLSLGKLSTGGSTRGNDDLSRGNVVEHTEAPLTTTTKLKRIATLSAENPEMKFMQLMHHFNEESLLTCYRELDGKKATGID